MYAQIPAIRTELKKRELSAVETDNPDGFVQVGDKETSKTDDAADSTDQVDLDVAASTSPVDADDKNVEISISNPDNGISAAAITSSESSLEISHLQGLVTFLEEEFRSEKGKLDILMLQNQITFDLLWHLFPPHSEITFLDLRSGILSAGKVWLTKVSFLMADYQCRISYWSNIAISTPGCKFWFGKDR